MHPGQWAADVRQALRAIRRMPWLAGVVVASLAAGIGVNTVIFDWIRGVVLRPLPGVIDGAALQAIEPITAEGGHPGVSWPEYLDLRDGLTTVRNMFASRMLPLYVGASPATGIDRVFGALVSPNYFDALALKPLVGRFPDLHDDPGALVVVASYGFWQSRLASASEAIGQIVRVNGQPLTVIGVTPPRFQGTQLGLSLDLFVPASLAPQIANGSRELELRGVRGYSVMGWRRGGVDRLEAQHELDATMARLARVYPATNDALKAEILPFMSALRGPPRVLPEVLAALQLFMLLLLAAVCGNVANLLLARASARERDAATRLALGARPWQIARLALVEAFVLALAGAGGGVLLALWGSEGLQSLPLTGFPIRFQTDLDGAGLAVALGLGLSCGLLCGAAPAWQLTRRSRSSWLRGGTVGGGLPASGRLRHGLMGAQAGLAAVVLVIAGLFLRSFLDTRTIDPGFDPHGVLLVAYDLAGRDGGPDAARIRREAARDVLERVRAMPGVEGAAVAASVPLDIHGLPSRRIAMSGHPRVGEGFDEALVNTVTDGYFAAMRIPLVAGRDVGDPTRTGGDAEAIVNVEFVRRFIEQTQPGLALGQHVRVGDRERTIVGVSANSLYDAFGEPPTPAVYLAFADSPLGAAELHVRTRRGREAAIAPDVRATLRGVDPGMALVNVRTLDQHVSSNLVFRRVPAQMFSVLGPLLLALIAIGIYAIVEYVVVRRTSEVGLRLALGASPGRVVASLVGEHMAVVASGVLLGWLVALIVAIVAGVVDTPVLVAVPLLLLSTAAAACWIPARRAGRLDPMTALRVE